MYYCGLRKGEANALTWNDIDFEKGIVKINKNVSLKIKGERYVVLPTKTKSSIRILPMPKVLLNDLKALKKEYMKFINYSNSWFVFGGLTPLSDSATHSKKNDNIKKVIESGYDLKNIRIHDFRHSCASLLINQGASISLVAKFLGHSNIATTLNTYTHLFKNEFDDIINIINKLES